MTTRPLHSHSSVPVFLHTPLVDILGCKVPIICAGMGGVARVELAAAVSAAGGLGTLGMVRESPEFIADQVREIRSRTDRPFSVNIIPAATDEELLAEQICCLLDLRVAIVTLFWDVHGECIQLLKDHGVTVIHQVGSVAEAEAAQAEGVDILIAQGMEAGGHVRGSSALLKLLPEVLAASTLPVVVAGGIATGKQLTEALLMGAQGVCMGTRFLATEESNAHEFHKAKIVLAEAEDTVQTDCFHLNWPRAAPVRVLRSAVTDSAPESNAVNRLRTREIGSQDGRPIYLYSTDSPLAGATGSLELMPLYAGHSCSEVESVLSVEALMAQLLAEARENLSAVDSAQEPTGAETAEQTSSPCSINHVDAEYGGYASPGEVQAMLQTLLEAERAGAQVCALTLKDAESLEWQKLLLEVHRDEVESCRLLIDCLENLGVPPDEKVGDFVAKCMAISDFKKRMELLNKGQAWVVRRLDELLPRLQSEYTREKLLQMKADHVNNIDHLADYLETK